MNISAQGLDLLIQREALSKKTYRDSKGLLTIGVGHLLTKKELRSGLISIKDVQVSWPNGLTFQQCLDLYRQDLIRFERAVNQHVSVEISQHQYDALVSFAFNVGTTAFKRSTLVRTLNQHDYHRATREFARWRIPPTIISRRAGEQAQFAGSVFSARLKDGFIYV